jgi:hypothetical protein
MFKLFMKVFGIYKGETIIRHGSLSGVYEVYEFFGKNFEFKK